MVPGNAGQEEPLFGRSGAAVVALYRRSAVVRLACDVMLLALGVFAFWLCWQSLKLLDDEDQKATNVLYAVGMSAALGGACFSSVDKRWGWGVLVFLDPAFYMEAVSDGDDDGDGGGDGGGGGD